MLAIVIPAYNPDSALPDYCRALRQLTPAPIVLVNDGSRPDTAPYFQDSATVPNLTLLTHPTNRGKGRALKTAFAHLLQTIPDLTGALTADADGQHTPADVIRCLNAATQNPTALVLGCRTFTDHSVPFRSRFGNLAIRILFRIATHRPFSDTQTGLRVIPTEFIRALLDIPGERFDFETRMLLAIDTRPLVQVPIQTVYLNGNQSSHFNPIRDSFRITSIVLSAPQCKRFALFTLISLLSFALDQSAFSLFYRYAFAAVSPALILPLAISSARAISLLFNFFANQHFVFHNPLSSTPRTFPRYLLLALPLLLASWLLTKLATEIFPGVRLIEILKCIVDLILFLLSYSIQRIFVFHSTHPSPK